MTKFPNINNVDEITVVGPITIRSACAHHLVPIMGDCFVAVIYGRELIGLSKFHRLTEWICARPQIQEEAAEMLADEIKMPVGKRADVEKLLGFLKASPTLTSRRPGRPARSIWLQPLSTSAKATAICIEAATVHGWRLSVQVHKFLGVR